jgi:hypothetical protein
MLLEMIGEMAEDLKIWRVTEGLRELAALSALLEPLITSEGILAFPIRKELDQATGALSQVTRMELRERVKRWRSNLESIGGCMTKWGKLV